LFTIFINDVDSVIDLPFLLYADDLVFWAFGSNPNEIVDKLTNTLSNLNNWCSENNLLINETKTEFMFFHKCKDTLFGSVPNVELNGKTIQRTFKFRYLGVMIEPTMFFKLHFLSVESILNSAIFKLQSAKRYVPELAMKIMFNTYVLPIYDYCIDVWCVHSESELSHLQSKINRFLFAHTYPGIAKKFNKIPTNSALRHDNAKNSHDLLLRFNLLSIYDRMKWTVSQEPMYY